MTLLYLIAIVVAFTAGVYVGMHYGRPRVDQPKKKTRTKKRTTKQTTSKNKKKDKITALLKAQKELSNEDLRKKLGVSARTIVNYMDELEREGRVKQVGETGRYTTYRLTS